MSDQEFEALRKQLEAFSARLNGKIKEFHDRGGFSETHQAFVTRIQQGHAAVEAKLRSAVHGGAAGASTKYEIERDLNALVDEFGHLEERLSAELMKQR